MEVELREHKYLHKSRFASVERSLRQDRVFMRSDTTGKMMHIGFIGHQDGAQFLPICGFPNELSPAVCARIQELRAEQGKFDVKPTAVKSPPTADELAAWGRNQDDDEEEE